MVADAMPPPTKGNAAKTDKAAGVTAPPRYSGSAGAEADSPAEDHARLP